MQTFLVRLMLGIAGRSEHRRQQQLESVDSLLWILCPSLLMVGEFMLISQPYPRRLLTCVKPGAAGVSQESVLSVRLSQLVLLHFDCTRIHVSQKTQL